jgi:hypothetical protein
VSSQRIRDSSISESSRKRIRSWELEGIFYEG